MKAAALLLLLLLASAAFADAPKAEEWVGTWSGKATSKGCSDTIATKLSLDVGVTSTGGLRSNGDVIIEGLGDLDWTAKGSGLVLDREGLTGSLKRSKTTAKLILTTAAGCVVKATLTRPTSGIASCDRVRALATAKAQCGNGETLTEVEASWAGWKKLKGKKKKAQAKACTEQAATLATETCAVPVVTGFAECDAYIAVVERYMVCDKVPQAARDGARQGIEAMKAAWVDVGTYPEEVKQSVRDACKQALDAMKQSAGAMGCSI